MGNTVKPALSLFTNDTSDLRKRISAAYPYYYIKDISINEADVDNAFLSWQIIMGSEVIENFAIAKSNPDFEFTSCLSWFFNIFYEKFFELCPESKEMFTNVSISVQGRLLAGVISSSFDVLKNLERLKKRLIKIVTRHNPMEIKARYYGLMGEALLWSLQFILGSRYTDECALAWTKIYSFLLSIIIPRAVEYEYKLSLTSGPKNININTSSPKSTSVIRSSIKSFRTSIEDRIINSVSLIQVNDKGSRKTAPIPSKKFHEDIMEITETREFEPVEYCPFSLKSNKINSERPITPVGSPDPKSKATSTAPSAANSNKSNHDEFKPIVVECDYIQYQRTGILDNTLHPSDKKNNSNTGLSSSPTRQHKITQTQISGSIDLSESEEIKLSYFNHTRKCPAQTSGTDSTTTVIDNNITDICYDDFNGNKLIRFNNKISKAANK